ncbi:MAG: hypothetical protein KGI71_06040 [Patescibacteria group bacterium]|nr:hypothetical protein [Patescibacteria group bacterium]
MNMIPRVAIEKAIEGGWKYHGSKGTVIQRGGELRWKNNICTERIELTEIALDTTFWQCLGKALGWKKYVWQSYSDYHYGNFANKDFTDDEGFVPPIHYTDNDNKYAVRYITYEMYAHHFYDIILAGKDTKPFWDELLK